MSWTLQVTGSAKELRASSLPGALRGGTTSEEERAVRERVLDLIDCVLPLMHEDATVVIHAGGEEFKRDPDGAIALTFNVQVHSHLSFAPPVADAGTPLTPEGKKIEAEPS